ncbi:hypothetical protein KPP03845_103435 [Streptomyces xanthophaeus]|uniref:hypothetical protein n=1 Tax=Streptomyces xanthophaeus TaxID=67385 RepID=UPI00233F72DD|nr:hypothetical protein [Streptomyces xanthophaeus]WCD87067.1 hypothetical protein KPP03845_103435 [Streptomyces xanthophaeus]
MTESGQGGAPQPGAPWGPDPAQPDPASGYPERPGQQAYGYPGQQPPDGQGQGQGQGPQGGPAYGQPGQPGAAYGYPHPHPGPQAAPVPGHVVGPGYEGPGDPHGYGYPPLPEAVTQYIPPVPAGPAQGEAATQYIPPVPAGPAHGEAATQYIPPVPAGPAHEEAATQYIPPVPAGPAHEEAATQYIQPVPAAEFDGLFRSSGGADDGAAGHTQHLPPVQEPVLRQPPRRPYPPRGQGQGPVPPRQQLQQPPHQQPPQQYAQPQYAPPPPPPEAPRKVSPAIIAAVVIGLAVVGLGVGSLLGDGKPQNNDPGAVSSAPAAPGGSAAPGGEAPVDPARPQAVQLDKLLADSNDSRASVIKAVEDIKSCKNLDQAAGDLRDAARQREELITRLQELKLDKLPDHAKLSAALTEAWQSSADADNSYAAWAGDAKDDKGCKDGKDGKAKSSDNAAAGNKASGEATKAKETASGLWNSIAVKYGLTKRDKSQL